MIIRVTPGLLINTEHFICLLDKDGDVTIGLTHGKNVTTTEEKMLCTIDELKSALMENRRPKSKGQENMNPPVETNIP